MKSIIFLVLFLSVNVGDILMTNSRQLLQNQYPAQECPREREDRRGDC